ncbi:MAG: hypothetical protein IPM97_05635 [Bdellovibrionaceae bacterium]|nr:hypothetical protein [Pseudobdellovibrionaceae bacterium]
MKTKLLFAMGVFLIGVGTWNYAFAVDLKFYFPVGQSISEIKKQPEFSKCSEIKDQSANASGITIFECAGVEPLLDSFKLFLYENKTYKSTATFKQSDNKSYEFNRALNVKFGSPSKKKKCLVSHLEPTELGGFLTTVAGTLFFCRSGVGKETF